MKSCFEVDAGGEVEVVEREIGIVAEEPSELLVALARDRDDGVAELVLQVLDVVAELRAQPIADLGRLQMPPDPDVHLSSSGRGSPASSGW